MLTHKWVYQLCSRASFRMYLKGNDCNLPNIGSIYIAHNFIYSVSDVFSIYTVHGQLSP